MSSATPSTSRMINESSSDDFFPNSQTSDSDEKLRSIDKLRLDRQHNATSVGHRSSLKRPTYLKHDVRAKRHRKSTSIDDLKSADPHRDAAEKGTYVASGLKNFLHGIVYQLKYLMLIVHRAREMDYSFRLATEMTIAGKFDDLVLRHKDNNGDYSCRFVQLKHKQDEDTNAITATNLLNMTDNDFGLFKCFVSWRKIKKHPNFRKDKLKDFILCTNIGLDVDSLKAKGINVRKVEKPDDLLTITISTKKPLLYKLQLEEECSLWDTLRSASDIHRLARELAERVFKNNDIHLNTDLIKRYHVALAKEVVDVPAKRFFVKFIRNESLSAEAAKFREILFQNTKRLLSKKNISEQFISALLEEKSLKLSATFGKQIQSATNPEQSGLPVDEVDDRDISSFLDQLIFAVNQPNEVELDAIIEDEIGPEFNRLDAGIVRDSFQIYILDWFKKKGGRFLTRRDADIFFDRLKGQLSSIKSMAVGLDHTEKLRNYGICFINTDAVLEAFIHSSNNASIRLLEMISPGKTLLTALRIFQTLTETRKRENEKSFTIVRVETLSREMIMELVLRAFKWLPDNNLLVIDCESFSAKEHLESLWIQMSDIMKQNDQKKVIVIAQEGKDLGTEWNLISRKTYRVDNTGLSFGKLTIDSQKKLLSKQVTEFQGHKNKTSFGELLGIDDCDKLGEVELRDLSRTIDSDSLIRLISKDGIQIGVDMKGLKDQIPPYYIDRTICRHVVIKKDVLQDDKIRDLFAISAGKNGLILAKLLRLGQMISSLRNFITNSVAHSGMGEEASLLLHSTQNYFILDDNREEEQFNALCAKNKDRNVHWLQWKQNILKNEEYIWKKSKGNITSLVSYRDSTESDDNLDATSATDLSKEDLTFHDEPVIISDVAGMGKSTLLTYLALNRKNKEPDMLVLKIDLNDNATALETQTENPSYKLCEIEGAVRFLVKELLRGETDLAKEVYERMIKQKNKVVLIFDGFDEICPDYENTVIDLLETFANHGIKKLVVATRPHTRKILETKLNAFSHIMKPFSKGDQEKFLTDCWKAKFNHSDNDLHQRTENRIIKYTTAIMEVLANSINDQDNKFTGNPLQAYLVAEVFGNQPTQAREPFDSCKDFIDSDVDEPKFPERIDLIYLYERFVENKFDVFFKRTCADRATPAAKTTRKECFDKFVDKHKRLALYALFEKTKTKELLLSQQISSHETLKTIDADIAEKNGIVTGVIDGQLQFGHQTYAEYFAAKFFTENLKTRKQNESFVKIFVENVLLEGNYKTLRAFIDWLLSNEHVDKLDGEFWPRYLKKLRSQQKGTIFHVAAKEGNGHITEVFLNCLDANTADRRDLIHVKDMLGCTAVHQAVEYGHLNIIRLLIEGTNYEINSRNYILWTPLHVAAQKGRLDVVTYLVSKGAGINFGNHDGSTPLHMAAFNGELDVIEYLVSNKAGIHSRNNNGWTPLHVAVREGKLDVIKYLVGKGAGINFRNHDGSTPLHMAAFNGELDVIEYLVSNKAGIHSRNNDGSTPLHIVVREGKLDVVKYLVCKRAKIDSQDNNRSTPLHIAVLEGKLDIVKYLVSKRAEINSQNNDCWTPLHIAAQEGKLDVVKYLVCEGAEIDSQNNDGSTPLHVAAQEGKLDVVKHLVRKGAEINSQNIDGSTPLHVAAQERKLDVVNYLVFKGAKIDSQNNNGSTPLHVVVRQGKLDVVKYLVGKEAGIDSRNNNGWTPLHVAAREGKLDVVKYLVCKGAEIDSQNNDGSTPLHIAVREGKLDVVECLVGKEARIESQNNKGSTPLHLAAWGGKFNVVEYLVDEGAGIDSQNNNGWTVLHVAARGGKLNVVEYLVGKGAGIDFQNHDGSTPLHIAAYNGKLDVIEYLVGNKAGIDSQNNNGWTPLHVAAREGKLNVVKYLVGKGARLAIRSHDGSTPLHIAAHHGKLHVVKYLVGNGADIHSQNNNCLTPLDAAVYGTQLNVVEYLQSQGSL